MLIIIYYDLRMNVESVLFSGFVRVLVSTVNGCDF